MGDETGSKSPRFVPYFLDFSSLVCFFGVEETIRSGKSWHVWLSELAVGVVFGAIGLRWAKVVTFIASKNPWKQLEQAKTRIEELSDLISPPSKLNIHSASWGSTRNRKPVLDAVNRQPKDALVLGVSNEVLGCDPAWGDDNKYVEVEYSYGDGPMLKATRKQGRILVLPEDKQFIEDTAADYERKRKSDVVAFETKLEEQRSVAAVNAEQIATCIRELQKLEGEKVDLAEKLTQKLLLTKPVIIPVSFGQQDRPEKNARWLGLLLSNDGREVAYEVEVIPFTIGKWSVNFESVLRMEVNEKTSTWINVWWGNTGNSDLREHIIEAQQANGKLGDPVPFRIKYRDSLENWFASECEFKLNVLNSSGLDVQFLRRVPFVP